MQDFIKTKVKLSEAKTNWAGWTRAILNDTAMAAFRTKQWYTDGLGRVVLQGVGATLYFVRDEHGKVYASFDQDSRNDS